MAFVADNSVILAWFVASQSTPYTEKMLERAGDESVHVPIVWHLEFANALFQLERRRKLKQIESNEIMEAVRELALDIDSSPPGQRRLLDLARRYDLSVYDASYLELAIRSSLELAAADGPLAAAARKAGLAAD